MKRGQTWLTAAMAAAFATGLVLTGVSNAVNPAGPYPMKGQFRFVNQTLDITAAHSGTMKLNKFKFNGNAVESGGYNTKWALTLNKKVAGAGSSKRTVSGAFNRYIPNFQQTIFTVTKGNANFKVASNNAIIYNASIAAVGTAGHHAGAGYACTMKGKRPPPAP